MPTVVIAARASRKSLASSMLSTLTARAALNQHFVRRRRLKAKLALLRGGEALAHLIKDVVAALHRPLANDAPLLEEVRLHARADDVALAVENAEELAEARRVVVHQRLGVAERLEEGVARQDALLDVGGRSLRALHLRGAAHDH
jgi:hypothetical protein